MLMNLVPTEIQNDAIAAAIIAANDARNAQHGAPARILYAFADPRHDAALEAARWLDAYAVGNHGQSDRCLHFCSTQRQLYANGFVEVRIDHGIYGWCVRDTMNDGLGILFGGRNAPGTSQQEAWNWATLWHREKPTHRQVRACEKFAAHFCMGGVTEGNRADCPDCKTTARSR